MTIPIKIISKNDFGKIYSKPNQKLVWDNISVPWGKYVVKKIPIVEEFLNEINLKHSKSKKLNIIEFGCGSGRNMIKINNFKYWCVDFSPKQLEHAKKYAKKEKINAEFFNYKIEKLNHKLFKNNFFDYGIFIATLHCLDSKEKRKKALEEFFRILKKNGQAIISVWDSEDKRFNLVKNKGDIYMSWRKDGKLYMRYYYLYKKQEFIGLLENVGFNILEIYNPMEHDRFSKKNLVVRVGKG